MIEHILIGVLIADAVAFIIVMALACNKEFLTWLARRDDPAWAKLYDELESDFLRLKNGPNKWGDN